MSALQCSIILIITCYTLNYEVTAISAKELKGDISTMWKKRFATLPSSALAIKSDLLGNILNGLNGMSYERRIGALLEDRVADEKQKRALLEDRVADEKQKRALLEEQLYTLQTTLHNLTHAQSLFQDQLSDEKQKRTLLQDQLSDEKQKRALLDERLDALQKTLHNSTFRQSLRHMLLEDRVGILQEIVHDATRGMSYEKQRRTQIEEELSHKKRNQTLLEERLDALQAAVYNATRELSCKERPRFLENQVEMVKEDLTTKTTNFADCWELRTRGGFNVSGVYDIYLAPNQYKLRVRCDMETDGGGWTVLQRRYDGSVNFNQNLEKYENGFGDVSGEHWAGLQWVHVLTSQGAVQMRVDLCTFSGEAGYAVYGGFNVSDGGDGYRLHVGRYLNGSIEDRLRHHDGFVFLTTGRCATRRRGGWWYLSGCFTVNLNGGLYNGGTAHGIAWYKFGGSGHPSLRSSEIKVRPLTAPGDPSRPYTCPP